MKEKHRAPKNNIHISIGASPIDWESRENWDLSSAEFYLSRELTWLNFNRRVLYEAENEENPLLERIKFFAIAASTIDDFFMKRIGGLKQLIQANIQEPSIDGRSPLRQLEHSYVAIHEIEQKQSELYEKLVFNLKDNDVLLLPYNKLDHNDKERLRRHFVKNIYPLLTPQIIDSAHPFPFISNLSLNILVSLSYPSQEEYSLARVKVPVGKDVPRFIQLGETYRFIRVEELVQHNLDFLFPSVTIHSCDFFRVTRNANTEKEEEKAEDLLEMIEAELSERKFAPIVRLQTCSSLDSIRRGFLCSELQLNEKHDVFEVDGMLGWNDMMEIANLPLPKLKYRSYHPIDPPRFKEEKNIFHNLRKEGPVLLFHPYESFADSVERFLREASEDPKVRAIKMTLYRTSTETKVINTLINAANQGKQVCVVVELKARFDEEANIQWANTLEEKGIHVTYGVVGFKTHAKVLLVVRKDYDGIRIYSHIGTGNYHAGTARLYTDLGILSADRIIGRDLLGFFNFLTTGYTPNRKYKKILVAPANLKKVLLDNIKEEIEFHKRGMSGNIQMKINALEDKDIVTALYQASQKGVKISLIIRDTCRLRPGIPGLSENISVRSIIGRFLEHARVYYFHHGGEEQYYLGSADAMQRNLEKRIEVLVPVNDPHLQDDLRRILDIQLQDDNSWGMLSDGSYERAPLGKSSKKSQEFFMVIAEKRREAAGRIKQLQSKGKSEKEFWSGHSW